MIIGKNKIESVTRFLDPIERMMFSLHQDGILKIGIAADCTAFYIFLRNVGYKNFEIARGDNSEVSLAFTDSERAQFFELIFQSDGSYILTIEKDTGDEYLENITAEKLVAKLNKPYKVWSNSSEQYANRTSSKISKGSVTSVLSPRPPIMGEEYLYSPMNARSRRQPQFVSI